MAAENAQSTLAILKCRARFNEAAAHGRGKRPFFPRRSHCARCASMRPRRMAAENIRNPAQSTLAILLQ